MGPLLALVSAVCYGLSDFVGGLVARRAPFAAVALIGQVGGPVLALAVAPLLPSAACPADLGWGALSGVGTGVGMVFLFRGLARGAMSVVVPTSAVAGVALPVLAGVAFLGERPALLTWLGIVIAVPALWLVSRTGPGPGARAGPAVDGLIASAGIAVQYLALAQAEPAAGAWPLVAGRVAAILTLAPWAAFRGLHLPPWRLTLSALAGAAAALALLCYLLATRHQLVVIAVVLSSLYPVLPVLLGILVLGERLRTLQVCGLLTAAAAVVLLTTT
ncbi:DMT family transporter [Amycolatopsis sp. FDAARGOS 1241]|uniref:DMT family transporter n=1 Tax=Amycolatopsis sp. FDAARGOS 1241 TaxID=2778070 RepID=UPI00194DCD93|nr:DMT family transporter [Amycolatopsis sp. FDAARGOS 1241]QRP50314.1 DMT family transporter [Amycolatopsis sp. FDAARGOS 1241]